MFVQLFPLLLSALLGLLVIPHMMLVSSPQKTRFIRPGDATDCGQGIPLSGIPFFLIVVITLCVSLTAPCLVGQPLDMGGSDTRVATLLQVFVGSALLFLVGLKDDLSTAGEAVRFGALLGAALVLPCCGVWIDDLHGLFGLHHLPMFVGVPLTALLVIYVTFAFSLLDGIDGLCCGFGLLALLAYYLLTLHIGAVALSVIAAAATGAVAVQVVLSLRGHRRPSMMGNSGAYVMGYIIASLTVCLCRGQEGTSGMTVVCFSVLVLPMFDVLRVLGSRIRDGRSIDTPDRNLFNFKLHRTGLRPAYIPLVVVLLMIAFTAFGLIGVRQGWNQTLVVVLEVLMWVALEYLLNWRIHIFEQANHKAEWNKLYGREAWNSNIPHEVMRHKIETYGTMGLPQHMQNDNPIEFIPDGMTGFGRSTKRLCDLMLSACCLVVFAPLFLLCYLLIKMDDGGPAIYSQERIGRFGRPFHIYKFRSMGLDAEKNGPTLSHANGDEDPRLTKVGRFLRQHHLDELPQLWNVFLGDMAFIGYRPERKFFIDQIMREDPRYAFLYQIRPGVTSYATLYNGYTDTMAKMLRRLELDLYYLRHRSWWFDCKVLFLTFTSIVFGKKF